MARDEFWSDFQAAGGDSDDDSLRRTSQVGCPIPHLPYPSRDLHGVASGWHKITGEMLQEKC